MISVKEPRTEILTLPWPPSANTSKFPVKGKRGVRMVSTKKLREYYLLVAIMFKGKIKPMDPPYSVRIDIYEPDRRHRDIANLEKAIVDSLVKAGVMEDDCFINKLVMERHPDEIAKPGKVVVTIREMT